MTIRLIILLLERALVQLLQAEGAHKVFRVELSEHGGNASSRNRLGAARAQGSSLGVVMRLAVRETLMVKEGAALERQATVLERDKEFPIGISICD